MHIFLLNEQYTNIIVCVLSTLRQLACVLLMEHFYFEVVSKCGTELVNSIRTRAVLVVFIKHENRTQFFLDESEGNRRALPALGNVPVSSIPRAQFIKHYCCILS